MLALVLLFSSAFNPVETGLKEGKQAPMLKLKNSEGAVTLRELKGRYVLLNFWAGYMLRLVWKIYGLPEK